MPFFEPVNPDQPLVKRIRHNRTDTFKFQNQSQDKDGNPFDFTGMTFVMEIKDRRGGTVVVTIPNENFAVEQSDDGAAAGVFDKFLITHPPADFADLISEPFEYYYDIQITDGGGELFTPIKGPFVIIDD